MRYTNVLAAALVAPLVAAHGSETPGAPKIFGLPKNLRRYPPVAQAVRSAAESQEARSLEARQGGQNGRCGPSFGGASCAAGYCCSAEVITKHQYFFLSVANQIERDTVVLPRTIAVLLTVCFSMVQVATPTRLPREQAPATMLVPKKETLHTALVSTSAGKPEPLPSLMTMAHTVSLTKFLTNSRLTAPRQLSLSLASTLERAPSTRMPNGQPLSDEWSLRVTKSPVTHGLTKTLTRSPSRRSTIRWSRTRWLFATSLANTPLTCALLTLLALELHA